MSDTSQLLTSEFEAEFRAFALEEQRHPAPRGAVLFYGSSTIRLWETLAADFPGLTFVNRGFGGSTLAECVHEMGRLVFPLQPRALVLYAGDNDLDQGARPERVRSLFQQFAQSFCERLGPVPVIFLSIKPSPARFWNITNIRRANELVRSAIPAWPNMLYLDVAQSMLDAEGRPRRELYIEDGLHMNREGYRLWAAKVRACLTELALADGSQVL